jgi:hypothetical protein
MTRKDIGGDEREAIELLLPWYVTGKLDSADAARVSAYLAEHRDMMRQVDLVSQERRAAIEGNEALGAPSGLSFERLMASIAVSEASTAAEARASSRRPGWRERWRLAELFAAPGAMRWAAASAAVAIVAEAAVIMVLAGSRAGEGGAEGYHVAGAPKAAGGVVALVTFADGATAAAITGFLDDFEGTIVDGPKPGGVYKVRFNVGGASAGPAADDLLRRASARSDVVKRVFR